MFLIHSWVFHDFLGLAMKPKATTKANKGASHTGLSDDQPY